MNKPKISLAVYLGLALFILLSGHALARSLEDWQLLYNHLRVEIEQHGISYPTGDLKSDYMPYVKALNIFAKDRELAWQAAQEAQASKDPAVGQYFDKFMDLVEQAQSEGDKVLGTADILFRREDDYGPRNWEHFQILADPDGKLIFGEAGKLKFNSDITREQMRLMFDKGLQDLDDGWSLICGRSPCGRLYPSEDRSVVDPEVDFWLPNIKKFEDLAEHFDLPDIKERTRELMNRYTKDALCLKEDKGLDWYRQLAEKHQLSDAQEHIEGFYGTLYGKVEVVEDEEREPASGAEVTNSSPKDRKGWQSIANRDGEYEIEKVPLHKHCGPYEAEARHAAGTAFEEYEGPLEEPSANYRNRQDLEIRCKPIASAKLIIEHDPLFAKEMALHRLENILDEEGRPAETGSRLIVCASKGRIDPYMADRPGVLTDVWQKDQRCGVYTFQGHPMFFAYHGPKPDACGGGQETIRVFNACSTVKGKKVPLKETLRGQEVTKIKYGLVCTHPRFLHLKEKEQRTSEFYEGGELVNICDYSLKASVRVKLGEARSARNIGMKGKDTGWGRTELPFESIEISEFDASRVCRGKYPGVYKGINPKFNTNHQSIQKRTLSLFHPWEDYHLVEYIDFNPLYFDFEWSDGHRGSFCLFFLEHTKDIVEPELSVGIYWLDQRVKSFLNVNHFEGSGYRLKGKTHTWWDWKLE
jgi:hypothetical protein